MYRSIDHHFNDVSKAKVLENKCFYSRLFPDVPMPETIALRMNGIWMNAEYANQDLIQILSQFEETEEVIIKRATASYGGKGVYFVSGNDLADRVLELVDTISGDIIIQKNLKQHPELAKLNASSVNTIRHISFLRNGNVKVYSSVLRMGIGSFP